MRRILYLIAALLLPTVLLADSESTIGGKTAQAHIIQAKGVSLRPRPYLNITGDSVVGTDEGGKTVITISGSGGGSGNVGIGTVNYIPAYVGISTLGPTNMVHVAGNIGVGTHTPRAKLHVGAGSDNPSATTPSGYFTENGNTTLAVRDSSSNVEFNAVVTSTGTTLYNQGNEQIILGASAGQGVVIRSGGNVGINSATPGQKLDVQGTVRASSPFHAPAGTSSFPSYCTTGDTNTGMNGPGSDVLTLITGGAEAVRIDSGGNIGIGTSTAVYGPNTYAGGVLSTIMHGYRSDGNHAYPIMQLQGRDQYCGVFLNAYGHEMLWSSAGNYTHAARFHLAESINARRVLDVTSDLNAGVDADPFYDLTVSASGNIGIGTFTSNASLEIVKNKASTTNDLLRASSTTAATGDLFKITSAGNVGIGSTNPGSLFDIYGSQRILNSGTLSVVGNISTNANMGIGTSVPSSILNIKTTGIGALTINADSDNSNESDIAQIRMTQDGVVSNANFEMDTNNDLVIGTNSTTSPNIFIGTRNDGTSYVSKTDSKIAILNGGNVGIGTTIPSGGLAVMNGNVGIGTWIPSALLEVKGGDIKPSGRVVKRVTTVSDATSITPNSDTTDIVYQANTQAAGTLTINADSGTPLNGQSLLLKLKCTNAQTFSWNAAYDGGTVALPTATTGSSTIDYYSFIYDTVNSKWHYTGTAAGL